MTPATRNNPLASVSDFPGIVWFEASDMDFNHTSQSTLQTGIHCNEHSNDIWKRYGCRQGAANPQCTGVQYCCLWHQLNSECSVTGCCYWTTTITVFVRAWICVCVYVIATWLSICMHLSTCSSEMATCVQKLKKKKTKKSCKHKT